MDLLLVSLLLQESDDPDYDYDDAVLLLLFAADQQRRIVRPSRHILAANLQHRGCRALLLHGSDSEYDSEFRFNRHVFWQLHGLFQELWTVVPMDRYRSSARLRNRALSCAEGLALVLRYLAKGSLQQDLCYFVGRVETTVSNYLTYGLELLYQLVRDLDEARIAWPSRERASELAEWCHHRIPQLQGCFGFLDGKLSRCPRPGGGQNDADQEAFYSGYYHMHATKELFVFLVDGTIAMAIVNAPGTWHDARVFSEGKVWQHLFEYPPHLSICGDTAFGADKPQLIRVLSETELATMSPRRRERLKAINAVLSGVRVASEWGIAALFRAFNILNTPIASWQRRGYIKLLCVHLFNVRTRTMGVNQIRAVFEPGRR